MILLVYSSSDTYSSEGADKVVDVNVRLFGINVRPDLQEILREHNIVSKDIISYLNVNMKSIQNLWHK